MSTSSGIINFEIINPNGKDGREVMGRGSMGPMNAYIKMRDKLEEQGLECAIIKGMHDDPGAADE